MILYLDTSLIVAAFTNEIRTQEVQSWLDKQKPGMLAISDWVVTEFSAALSIKVRMRHIKATHRAGALALFTQMAARSLTIFQVQPPNFRTAARFADQYALGLRAGDALHLAVAADQGATLCTFDRRLAGAGSALAVQTLLL